MLWQLGYKAGLTRGLLIGVVLAVAFVAGWIVTMGIR